MKVSVGLPIDHKDPDGDMSTADGIATVAKAAEDRGFDAVFVTDHPAPDQRWISTGGHDTLDPFVALSFAAAATSMLRLHTNLLVLGYRNPLLAAKAVASLDALSNGRVIVGVGVGYLEAEFDALGADFHGRSAQADDALAAMKQAWQGEPFDRDGVGYKAAGTVVLPRPARRPNPPIWVGGNSRAAMRRAVEQGDGWSPMPSPKKLEGRLGTPGMESIDDLADGVRRLREMEAAAGRTARLDVIAIPKALSVWGTEWDPAAALDEIGQLTQAGATGLVINLPGKNLRDYLASMDRFATEVLAEI